MIETREIDLIVEAGGKVTPEYRRIESRMREFEEIGYDRVRGMLTDALTGQAPIEELAELHALALAVEAAGPVQKATISNAARTAFQWGLIREYEKVARDNYEALRERFNQAARDFTTAAAIVDPSTAPAVLVGATDKIRKAWLDGQTNSQTLSALLRPLVLAATNAGVNIANRDAPIGHVMPSR